MFRRKKLALLLCCIYISTILLVSIGCTRNDNIATSEDINFDYQRDDKSVNIPFKPVEYEAKVSPYEIKKDLSNIENLEQFGDFTQEQKNSIIENGFVVMPTKEEQLFYIYENNEYMKIPSFVTTDSVLQVYHVFYDYSLRTLENEKLIGILEKLTNNMIEKSIYLYDNAKNDQIKSTLLKNISFFSVAQLCLDKELPENIPQSAKEMAIKEYGLIDENKGFSKSNILPYQLDYSQYKPRGHYTRNDDLKRYFKAMMWYGQVGFPLHILDENGKEKRAMEETLQALLITYTVFLNNEDSGDIDIQLWENIYEPTGFYVGTGDDLNLYHYRDLILDVYGKNPDISEFSDKERLNKIYEEAEKLPEPKIKAKYTQVNMPVGKQFRFMGQRYVPDAEIIQEMVEPIKRPIPSGLDVMAVLGSQRAYDIQIDVNKENEKWDGYVDAFNKMNNKFTNISDDKYRSNMYYGWLWTLKGLLRTFDDGYPSFMTNSVWEDKSLNTALASWSELKHDTVLYGKQSGAECGGGEEPPQIKGYVEPNIEVYERLLWLTKYSKLNLKNRNLLTGSLEDKLQKFEELLQFLIDCSVKQLNNEELTDQEYYDLLTYGGLLEYLTSSFAGDGMRWFEITSDTDKNMAIISDIHTIGPNQYSAGGYFQVGVGPASEIFVVVPIDGKLYITRGAVFSYYEFVNMNKSQGRLTDEEWQNVIKENRVPEQPKWMDSFIKGIKKDMPIPKDPYETGC
ncbi:DUF3160 domain-containing protein [Clostridiisalibacter paucivorans]|uniref:DUF3160 domain-containing protein n=1 Tax=Clostridiisalibacter paucivorans TaxID=408753 RepID=UPI00047C5DE3|nr:DUF3160 domain-containing protein [Clostridiisalibacter paucivorans]